MKELPELLENCAIVLEGEVDQQALTEVLRVLDECRFKIMDKIRQLEPHKVDLLEGDSMCFPDYGNVNEPAIFRKR